MSSTHEIRDGMVVWETGQLVLLTALSAEHFDSHFPGAAYGAVALHRGQCDTLLRYGKLATSSFLPTASSGASWYDFVITVPPYKVGSTHPPTEDTRSTDLKHLRTS